MAKDEAATRTWVARSFTAVEDVIYLGLAVLLAVSAGTLLVELFLGVGRSILARTFADDIVDALDRLLLILLIVELLYTVQVSFREHTVVPEPFLLIGLIAVIRRVLVVTTEIEQARTEAPATLMPLIWELAVLAGLVLAISAALGILRRGGSAPQAKRA